MMVIQSEVLSRPPPVPLPLACSQLLPACSPALERGPFPDVGWALMRFACWLCLHRFAPQALPEVLEHWAVGPVRGNVGAADGA